MNPLPLIGSDQYFDLVDFIDSNFDQCLEFFPQLTKILMIRIGVEDTLYFVSQYGSKRVSCRSVEELLMSKKVSKLKIDEDLSCIETEFIEVQSKLGFMSSVRRFICEQMIESGMKHSLISNVLGVSYSTVRRLGCGNARRHDQNLSLPA